MPTAAVTFTITSAAGTTRYIEGTKVPQDVADKFPHFMANFVAPKERVHNPNLPEKLTRSAAQKRSEGDLIQWIQQYHPGSAPAGKIEKAELVDIVMQLQE